jgi:hypothetical protein
MLWLAVEVLFLFLDPHAGRETTIFLLVTGINIASLRVGLIFFT